MPVILNEIIKDHHRLGLWQVEEDFDSLFSMVSLKNGDCETLNSFQNLSRRVEWLSVRAMLKELIKDDTGIYYNERRKPFLCDHSMNISISHSYKLTSILLSKTHRVGIDLEYMSHRIGKISDKFMNSREYISPDKNLAFYHLYIHWCAKEALYKICDKDNLNFKYNLVIDPFEPQEKGILNGKVIKGRHEEKFQLNYFKLDNYIVVWCIK